MKGFTLIELLVVCAIICTLLAIGCSVAAGVRRLAVHAVHREAQEVLSLGGRL